VEFAFRPLVWGQGQLREMREEHRMRQEPSTLERQVDREILAVTTEDHPLLGVADPLPDGPHHRDQQALAVPWGHVDQQPVNLAGRDRLEVLGDVLEVPARDKRTGGHQRPDPGQEGRETRGRLPREIFVA